MLSVPTPHSVGDRMINEYGPLSRMSTGRENGSTRRKPAPVPLFPPQIPHDLNPGRRGGKPATNSLSSGTAPRSSIPKGPNVSENRTVSILKWKGGEAPTLLGSSQRANLYDRASEVSQLHLTHMHLGSGSPTGDQL
jgi:hypothetical protein